MARRVVESPEKKAIKKVAEKYGNNFKMLIENEFQLIKDENGNIDREGLRKTLDSLFGSNVTHIGDYIVSGMETQLKALIYTKYYELYPERKLKLKGGKITPKAIRNIIRNGLIEKRAARIKPGRKYIKASVEKILKSHGYTLIECTTEEEIQAFRKYYRPDEILCTIYNGGRLKTSVVYFAVHKSASELKREDFGVKENGAGKKEEREDEYGRSVLSIQFTRKGMCKVDIITRYNDTVNAPNQAFDSNLDKLAKGLTYSFAEKLWREKKLRLGEYNLSEISIPEHVRAADGKYYKYNLEINGTYYCPGNIIIRPGGLVEKMPPHLLLIDNFILDMKNKTLQMCDSSYKDSFVDAFEKIQSIENIEEEIVDGKKTGKRKIIIHKEGQTTPIIIKIDRDNQIVGYENDNLKEVRDDFLKHNKYLTELSARNLKCVGNDFLANNRTLKKLLLENLEEVGDNFLSSNVSLKELSLKSLEKVGNGFLAKNKIISSVVLPKLNKVGDKFLSNNMDLTELLLENLEEVGNNFLKNNECLFKLLAPKLKSVGNDFLASNEDLTELSLESLEQVGDNFIALNDKLSKILLPNFKRAGNNFLLNNRNLKELVLENLEEVGNKFLAKNNMISSVILPQLKIVGDDFLLRNINLEELSLENLEEVGNNFITYNECLFKLFVPKLKIVENDFLMFNEGLTELSLESLEQVGDNFIELNNMLNKILLPNLKKVGNNFLQHNRSLSKLFMPLLKECGVGFLYYNSKCEVYAPNCARLMEDFKSMEMVPDSKDISVLGKAKKITASEIARAKTVLNGRIKSLVDKIRDKGKNARGGADE